MTPNSTPSAPVRLVSMTCTPILRTTLVRTTLDLHFKGDVKRETRWLAQYGGMKASDAKRLKELEGENARLKRLLADAELDAWVLYRSRPCAALGEVFSCS